jgi:hypothetical protein
LEKFSSIKISKDKKFCQKQITVGDAIGAWKKAFGSYDSIIFNHFNYFIKNLKKIVEKKN